ncbi:MAG: type transport system ATP-binding protein [Acidimicrobiaceae bacterium]|nr:type transport system ATP-binding protein [Acidimicrobiaceae bacterium]
MRTRSSGDPLGPEEPGGVVVEHLVKRYRKNPVPAVDDVSFTVGRGEIFGLLGPNGAGKTTTIGVLTTRVRPDSGTAFVGGIDVINDPVAAKSRLAVVPQRNNLDRGLTIRQNLLFHAAYHGVPKREREDRATLLLEQFGLVDRQSDKVDMFSGGQMQRVMIARALMHAPDVLFLDEPTTGLDPAARLFVWDRIRELRHAGVTVVITTHDMDEAAELADRVAIMDHGHLLALDTPEALTRELPGSESLDVTIALPMTRTAEAIVGELDDLDGIERVEVVATSATGTAGRSELRMRLYLSKDAVPMVATLDQFLAERGAGLVDFRLSHHSLEDVFLHLTGRLLR